MARMKICFVGTLSSAFIKNDYEILKKHFDVDAIEPPKKKTGWLKYVFSLAEKVKRSNLTFCWFAGWHSAFAVFFSKIFGKTSIVIAGGYDAAYVPEINYGAFTNLKERIPAKYVLKNADLILAVSEFTKNEVLKWAKPKRMKVLYNGVNVENYKPEEEKDDNLVITVGGIQWSNLKRKGIETFVKSAQIQKKARFVVIGKFIDDSIGYLKTIAPSNVEFTGFISDDNLTKWYQKAKVICQISYYESFGLSLAEGMACCCIPVVTKERVGLPEFVEDTGFYVPYGDEKAAAEAVKKALYAADILGKKARERIKEKFSIKKREVELIKIIEGSI
jgi:glycosyltransferase involved in cell wall biosynthesis